MAQSWQAAPFTPMVNPRASGSGCDSDSSLRPGKTSVSARATLGQ